MVESDTDSVKTRQPAFETIETLNLANFLHCFSVISDTVTDEAGPADLLSEGSP